MQTFKKSGGEELADHPAAKALALYKRSTLHPTRIDTLKEVTRDKVVIRSAVYRLMDAESGGETFVIKKGGRKSIETERKVYQELLPVLSISSIRCHGVVEDEDSRFAWLILEDAGDKNCGPKIALHSRLAGKWLGSLHVSAMDLNVTSELVSQGYGEYEIRLVLAKQEFVSMLDNEALQPDDLRDLRDLMTVTDQLLARWSQLEEYGYCSR